MGPLMIDHACQARELGPVAVVGHTLHRQGDTVPVKSASAAEKRPVSAGPRSGSN
jgi:hypothetical protein